MEEDWLNLATKKLIEDKPNTFTYTKWISESLIEREASDLPVVIIRPSNIGAAWKEPFAVKMHTNRLCISSIVRK
jgi:fatty acyl-CoA reductase